MNAGHGLHAVPMVAVEQVPETPDPEREAHAAQAQAEGVATGRPDEQLRVECLGEQYRIADKVGLMPLMRFAWASKQGIDTEDMEGLAAIYDMLRDCLHPEDWPRFEADMGVKKAEAHEMLPLVGKTIELLAARPTLRPSDSSDGSPATGGTSTGGSSSRPDREGLTPVADLVASQV